MKELLPICHDDQHKFAPAENTVTPTCGWENGAAVIMELMVVSTPAPKDYLPQPGDVCQHCFQIYGQADGVRDETFVRYFNDLASWE